MVQIFQLGLCPALKLVNRAMMRDERSRIALLGSYIFFYEKVHTSVFAAIGNE